MYYNIKGIQLCTISLWYVVFKNRQLFDYNLNLIICLNR